MIGGVKIMIGRCIERRQQGGCGTCARRDPCAQLFGPGGLFASLFRGLRAPDAASGPSRGWFGEMIRAAQAPRPALPSAFRREVEARIEPLLAAGPVRADTVARALGYSRQTLYRRLKAEGTSFEAVAERLRERLATEYLAEAGLAVKDVAYRLGFSDPAAFSRAYKRWTGRSPRDVQRNRKPH